MEINQDEMENTTTAAAAATVEIFTAPHSTPKLLQHHCCLEVVKDLRRTSFLLGGISMALLVVRCIIQPLLEIKGLVV